METPRYSKLAAMVIASLSATAALAAPQTDAQDTMVVTASGFQQKNSGLRRLHLSDPAPAN